jgi:acyl-CoA thioester hydrolase
MTHRFPVTVYYEDTDMAGIVYYANYLRYIERARSEIVEQIGLDQNEMRARGVVFAVTRVEADYLSAARLGDRLVVVTDHAPQGAVRWVFDQRVEREGREIFRARVTAVCMSAEGRPLRLPAELRRELSGTAESVAPK